jgi:cobalamin biosynthesis Mg chelatase CobN
MRRRPAILLVLAILLSSLFAISAPTAGASGISFAQEGGSESSDQGGEGDSGATDEDEGSGSTEAEVGSNEGQTETAETETGPPWTYQMARMIVVLLLLMMLALGFLYWRLVVQRQRRGI